MKRAASYIILGMLLVFGSLSFVSADIGTDAGNAVNTALDVVVKTVNPILKQIIGDSNGSDLFFAKVIFLFVIFAVIWKATERIDFFNDHSWVMWVVSIGASILATRYVAQSDIIKGVLLPYSVLGVAITAGLPFVLAFLIIEGMGGETRRKIGWIFFGVVFLMLWVSRKDMGPMKSIYLITAGASLVMIVLDGTFAKIRAKISTEKTNSLRTRKLELTWQKKLKEIDDAYNSDTGGKIYKSLIDGTSTLEGFKAYEYDQKEIKKHIAELRASQ